MPQHRGRNRCELKRSHASQLACTLLIVTAATLCSSTLHAHAGKAAAALSPAAAVPDLDAAAASAGTEAGTRQTRQDSIGFGTAVCQQEITGADYEYMLPAKVTCMDSNDNRQPFSIQLGQRIGARNGILGELDGVRMDLRVGDALRLNGIAGYPVLTAEDVFNPERQLFGISATSTELADAWELNGYLFEQQSNGLVTDRSMGGAMRYLRSGKSLLVYLDYDPATGAPGALLASGAMQLPFRTTLSATLDRQRRPIPALQRKYISQSMRAMDGWDWILPDDRLALHTAGGDATVDVLALDLSYALTKRIKLRGDMVRLDVTGLEDSATRRDISEYYYHLKITGQDLLLPGDRSKLDLRHAVTDTGRSYTATFDIRYAVMRCWNVISQLRADYQVPLADASAWWEASPTVKMEYRPGKQYGFHIEAGGNVAKAEHFAAAAVRTSYFVNVGYQVDF